MMSKYKSGNNISLSTSVLTCTLLALSPWNLFEYTSVNSVAHKKDIFRQIFKFQSTYMLVNYLSNNHSMSSIYELVSELLQIINTLGQFNNLEFEHKLGNIWRLKQYLRKFRFLYQYYHLKAYPNDLSTLSVKKINNIAIRSLFLFNSF